jgi:uncharacterized repeat protein (TIGR02543 family)
MKKFKEFKIQIRIVMIMLLITALPNLVSAANPSQQIYSGGTSNKVIALTFDDCSDRVVTQAIFDILQKNKIKATFFAAGKHAEEYPELIKSISDAGDQIANHTYSHAYLSQLSYSEIQDELDKADDVIVKITGKTTKPYFRTPYYDYNSTVFEAAGDAGYSKAIMCDVNTSDWTGIPASQITSTVLDTAVPGSIVGMHASADVYTADALQDIITGLKDRGYSFVTVADLLNPSENTVTFKSQGGSAVSSISADFNSLITAPPSPEKTGYTFVGWYVEAECINEWDFASDKVTSDLILYAKWTDKMNVLAGADRYETAVEISKAGYDSAGTAVLATGMNFPDALAAGPLAVQEGAPVLLTQTNSIPQSTLDELIRLNVKKVIIMGGEDVVAPAEANMLAGMGISVERISGIDRYGTAVEAAKKVRAKSGVMDKIVIATGLNFPDALCIGSYASKEGIPILLTAADTLTDTTKAAITEFGIKQAVIAGGDDVVSQNVVNQLTAMGITVTRSSGDTRYGTSVDIAGRFFPDSVNAIAATGLNYPDALAAVPLAAKMNATIILVERDAVPSEVSAYLPNSKIAHITVVGDKSVVGQAVKEELTNLLK